MNTGSTILPLMKRAFVPLGLRLGTFDAHAPKPISTPMRSPVQNPGPTLKVSIVTPSFNQGRFLEETISSVLDQDYPNFQYIIQDGGSTDHSVEIINHHAKNLKYWTSAPDKGQADAINLGFAQSDGEIMAWLNADDILLPGAISIVAQYFQDHPQTDVVYGHRVVINQSSNEVGRWILPKHRASALLWRDYVPQETMFWRRSLWDRVGGQVRSDYQFAMDWELISRFHTAGARFDRLPHFLACFRTHDTQKSLTQRVEVGELEFSQIRQTLLQRPNARLAAQISGLGYLAESMLWHWAYRSRGLCR